MADDEVQAFLTDRRREFLDGEYDLAKAKDRQLKKAIKDSSHAAVQELIEVATSPAIDTRDVFDTDDVFLLLRAILVPDEYTGTIYPSDSAPDEWLRYHDRMYVQMDKLMHGYRDGRFPDPDDS